MICLLAHSYEKLLDVIVVMGKGKIVCHNILLIFFDRFVHMATVYPVALCLPRGLIDQILEGVQQAGGTSGHHR